MQQHDWLFPLIFFISALGVLIIYAWPRISAWQRVRAARLDLEARYQRKLAHRDGIDYHANWFDFFHTFPLADDIKMLSLYSIHAPFHQG
jgi:hypothetical protein